VQTLSVILWVAVAIIFLAELFHVGGIYLVVRQVAQFRAQANVMLASGEPHHKKHGLWLYRLAHLLEMQKESLWHNYLVFHGLRRGPYEEIEDITKQDLEG